MNNYLFLAFIFCMFPISLCCEIRLEQSEGILRSPNYPGEYPAKSECVWKITVQPNSRITLTFQAFELENRGDADFVEIRDGLELHSPLLAKFCGSKIPEGVRSTSNNMFVRFVSDHSYEYRGFSATFVAGNGIVQVRGVTVSRENAVTWLKSQKSISSGWGKNTHRAITALYLADAYAYRRENCEEALMVKELELQTSVALLRNSTDPITVKELIKFVNALTVTCHNPRKFYGYDLLQILRDRVSETEPPSPSAYLALCNSNWTFSENDAKRLLRPLDNHSKYPFISDVQAVAVMALTCMKNKPHNFGSHTFPTNLYNRTIETFIAGQLSDGSFGNVYTTALVTQALIASGQETNEEWNVTATAHYLMQQLNSSSIDFLSAYLTLPIFSGRSLLDITNVDCSNITRSQGEDSEILDIMNRLGDKMRVQYTLYVGDQKDVVHTILLRMPENSSAYDVMRVAQVADPKYKFLHRDVSGQMYVYEIAGITNDPEDGTYWLLYTRNRNENGTTMHHIESPDEYILEDDEHLIMWYKTADIYLQGV